jgi:hypothetical protein
MLEKMNLIIGGLILAVFAYLMIWFWYNAVPKMKSTRRKRNKSS